MNDTASFQTFVSKMFLSYVRALTLAIAALQEREKVVQ